MWTLFKHPPEKTLLYFFLGCAILLSLLSVFAMMSTFGYARGTLQLTDFLFVGYSALLLLYRFPKIAFVSFAVFLGGEMYLYDFDDLEYWQIAKLLISGCCLSALLVLAFFDKNLKRPQI
jgi:hypothetical protein